MSHELIALNAQISAHMAHHTDRWPPSLRAFDVVRHCGELALRGGRDGTLIYSRMFDARLVVAFWMDANAENYSARHRLETYLESL